MGLIAPGREISREAGSRHVPRHAHLQAYAALVLRGGYVEAGDRGRFRAGPGDVLLHDRFESHQDEFERSGADILNLRLPRAPWAFGRVDDPDAVARLAERDAAAAAMLLLQQLVPAGRSEADWPDRLASDLSADRAFRLESWARQAGLRPQSLSRGFRLAYGVSPQRFRAEQRAARAARALSTGRARLADVALETGFADQPHMARTLRHLYALTPMGLRRHVQCVQDGGAACL